ncbi:MAG TPA: hypothetical protein PLA83_07630 [Deltaproteobacteria bacterium]|mgnify:FL=1|nr:hypothetical protein [Deltaproteobacteria bacterium]HQI02920.1 hypothetical protein [Deltaproteobacteria bacterium]HQJ07399.1 hypothetical protein [Deltaproteobacteria bacterium]
MGKIRSTLDIVMERTKNLSMTQDDRQKLKLKEQGDTVRAWSQRYLDGKMTIRELASQLSTAGDDRIEMQALLKEELIGNIRLEEDNSRVLDALADLSLLDRERAERVIRYRQEELEKQKTSMLDSLKIDLAHQGFRGSAVIPNLARSRAWQEILRQAQEDLVRELILLS